MARPNPNRDLEDLKTAAQAGRLPHEREAWLNVSFYLGNQYVEWHAPRNDPGYLREIPARAEEGNEPRIVINKIMHFARGAQAEALQERPMGDVLPPTASYSDISDSRVAKSWIDDQADPMKLDYDTKLSRATQWAILCGTGYLKWLWDAGPSYGGGNGKPCLLAPSWFEVYLDPYAKMFSDCRHIIQSSFMDVEQVYDKYGIEVNGGPSQVDEAKTSLLRGMGCAPALSGAVVNELWQLPSRRYPKGRYAVWTGRERLVPPDNLPYEHLIEHRMLPYTQLGVIERPDSPYYLSPVQYLRPAQMELNVAHNQAFKVRRNFGNGKVFLEEGLELNEPWDDSTGQVLKAMPGGTPGAKPQIIQPVYASMTEDLNVLEQGMMHIVGQHEVSQAQVPGRVEAAKAIELLRESDAGALAVLRKTTEVSNTVGWWQMLQLARAYQTVAEMVPAYSKEGLPEVKHFKAGDMQPGFRIRTTMTTGLARSRTNRIETVMRMVELGILDKDRDQETIAELLETPLSNTNRSNSDDLMLSRNENLDLAADKAIEPGSWDDHETHIREHNKFRKSIEYIASSKDVKQKFEHHVQRHKALQKEQIAQQAELQMIAQGGQPPQPQPAAQPAATPQEGE